MAELKLDLTAGTGTYTEQEAEIMERLWTTQPYSKNQSLRRMDRVCITLAMERSVSNFHRVPLTTSSVITNNQIQ